MADQILYYQFPQYQFIEEDQAAAPPAPPKDPNHEQIYLEDTSITHDLIRTYMTDINAIVQLLLKYAAFYDAEFFSAAII